MNVHSGINLAMIPGPFYNPRVLAGSRGTTWFCDWSNF